MDWLDLLAVQGTLKSLLQHHSSKASILQLSAFFIVQLSHLYFGHLMRRVDSLEKTHAGRDWGQGEKGTTKDEMAGWHHRLDGRESE